MDLWSDAVLISAGPGFVMQTAMNGPSFKEAASDDCSLGIRLLKITRLGTCAHVHVLYKSFLYLTLVPY